MYGPVGKPEFHLLMDTQVAFINKMDVAKFRARLVDAETHLHAHIPLLLFDNSTTIRGWTCATGMACTTMRSNGCCRRFCSQAGARRCFTTATRSA